MTGRQIDKYSMLLVVLSFMKKADAATISQMPGCTDLLEKYEAMIEKMSQHNRGQNLNRTGIRISKLQLRSEMTVLALINASRLEAYAISINDLVLQQKVTFKEYKLNKSRENTVASTCNYIHNIALENVSQLSLYGITAETLAQFKDAIDEYSAIIPKTRLGIVTRLMCTSQIKDLFEEFDKTLFRLDGLVKMLRFSNPTFYNQYFSCRKIITRGTRKQALRGQIKDQNGNTLDRVEVSINTTPIIQTKSGEKGNYIFKRLPGGVFPITFSRLGYISETIFIAITPLISQELNIQLKKAEVLERLA